MPSLSVIIVTQNRKEDLMRLLEDLRSAQGRQEMEILVIDNGSTDETARHLKAEHPGVSLLRFESNAGAPAARNAGAAAARGEALIFLDDDTRIEDPEFCDRVAGIFKEHDEAGIVAFKILDPANRTPRSFEIPSRRKNRWGEIFETSYFISAGCAIRRQVYRQTGGMDSSLVYGFEELDFSYRAVARGFRIFYRPEVWVLHGMSPQGRPVARRIFYFLRNKIWISARYLPWRMFLTQVLAWSGYFLLESIRVGRPHQFLAALWAGGRGMPARLRLRRTDRLSPGAVARLKQLEGRLYV